MEIDMSWECEKKMLMKTKTWLRVSRKHVQDFSQQGPAGEAATTATVAAERSAAGTDTASGARL